MRDMIIRGLCGGTLRRTKKKKKKKSPKATEQRAMHGGRGRWPKISGSGESKLKFDPTINVLTQYCIVDPVVATDWLRLWRVVSYTPFSTRGAQPYYNTVIIIIPPTPEY